MSRADVGGGAIRICDRQTHVDRVEFSSSFVSEGSTTSIGVVGASGTRVVLGYEKYERYEGCRGTVVTIVDGVRRENVRSAESDACGLLPRRPATTIVTPQGAAAWLVGERLVAIDGTAVRELDRGTITDLAPTADGVGWRSSGTPRSAPLA